MAMTKYSEKFKNEMVQKLLGPGAMSALRLSKECGVAQATLSSWLRRAKLSPVKKTAKQVRSKRWTAEEKLRVVMAATAAGEEGMGEVLRREGLHDEDLERFKRELVASAPPGRQKRDPADKKRIKELEREVRRKDKALAEATALVVLSKKLNAYFAADEVGDTNEESEK